MEKIQTEVMPMMQKAMKMGSGYQASGVDAAFDRMLKEQNQAADSKMQDAAASKDDSGQEVSDIGKDKTKPVKESGQKEKTEDAKERVDLKQAEIVPSELLLQFQESAGQVMSDIPKVSEDPEHLQLEGISEVLIQPEEVLIQPEEVLTQPEEIPESVSQPVNTAVMENFSAMAEIKPAEEDFSEAESAAFQAEDRNDVLKLQPERAVSEEKPKAEVELKAESKAAVQTAKPLEYSESMKEPGNATPQEASVRVVQADAKEGTEKQDGQEQQQQFAGITELPREYAAPKTAHVVSEPVRTSEPTLINDVGRAIAQRLPGSDGTLTIELEPASLGKLTIHVLYESGKATVSILSTNPRTLELLNTRAAELASILEERTGQETVIIAEQPSGEPPFDEQQGGGQQKDQQESREHKEKADQDSFLQQLRLGFI